MSRSNSKNASDRKVPYRSDAKKAKGCPIVAMQMLLSDVYGCPVEEYQVFPLFRRILQQKHLSKTYEHLAAIIRD